MRVHSFVLLFCVIFSSWLMFHTFSYDGTSHDIRIAYKLWSDFGAHIPMIRSFSMGDNLERFMHGSVAYPIFPGEPIRYHYLFYMLVGALERLGVRLDLALNIPSSIGLSTLLFSLYYLAWKLTGSKATGILTVLFFLFNGSLGFIRFFTLHPLSMNSLSDIAHVKDFPSFAPWGPGQITAFWNLNIYTNQRHLAAAFSLIVLFILTCMHLSKLHWKKQVPWAIGWGLLFGLLPTFHQPALLILAIIMMVYFVSFPSIRVFLLLTGILSLGLIVPQLYATRGGSSPIEWYPGYTIHNELAAEKGILQKLAHIASYWWENLGLHSILILSGLFFLPKKSRLYLLPIIPLFIIPNLVKFSVEASANHKFFNFVLILGSISTAHVLVQLWTKTLKQKFIALQVLGIYISIFLLVLLTMSGVIDMFVIINDTKGTLPDTGKNAVATWIRQNTPPSSIFLNSNYLYHPASLAGRSIFLGWPYFAWSAGYKENRMPVMNIMYETRDSQIRCRLLNKYNISYVTVEEVKNDTNLPRIDLQYYLQTYTPIYKSERSDYAIFTTASLCK